LLLFVGLAGQFFCALPVSAQSASATLSDVNQISVLKAQELTLIETLVKDFPERIDPLVLLGNTLYRHGNGTRALEVWHDVLKRNPQRADIHDTLATFAMKQEQYDRALQHWRKALAVNPTLSGVHGSMARALMGLGRQHEAMQALLKEIEISPESSQSLFLLGKLYLQEGRVDAARTNYEAAIRINPQHTNAYYGLFTVHTRLKDTERAGHYLNTFKQLKAQEKQALKANTTQFDDLTKVKKDLAQTCAQAYSLYTGSAHTKKALTVLERAIEHAPQNVPYLATLATHYQETGRLSEALALFERISQLSPRDARAFLNMERLLIKLGRPEAAEAALQKVIELIPEQAIGYREMAMLYLRTDKNPSYALEMASKALTLEPVAASYFVQAWAWEKNGQPDKARKALERAAQLEPDNVTYRRAYERLQAQERP